MGRRAAIVLYVLALVAVYLLLRSRLGLVLTAVRDDEVAARSSGARVGLARMLVFVVAGIGCGAAGALLAVSQLIVPRHYTRVAVIEDNAPGGLGNTQYMQSLASQNGYSVVASQITNPGATDDTPQALNLLKANPQIIVLGLIPGPDTITFIKAVRAQNPTIPISECSACELPSFISAAGGASVMKNIYVLGSMSQWLDKAQQGTSAQAKATAERLDES